MIDAQEYITAAVPAALPQPFRLSLVSPDTAIRSRDAASKKLSNLLTPHGRISPSFLGCSNACRIASFLRSVREVTYAICWYEITCRGENETSGGSDILLKKLVGASGFEPPASWSRTRRASQAALRPECALIVQQFTLDCPQRQLARGLFHLIFVGRPPRASAKYSASAAQSARDRP
jgi:hypothetical protein